MCANGYVLSLFLSMGCQHKSSWFVWNKPFGLLIKCSECSEMIEVHRSGVREPDGQTR
jgi:hypothetical protein